MRMEEKRRLNFKPCRRMTINLRRQLKQMAKKLLREEKMVNSLIRMMMMGDMKIKRTPERSGTRKKRRISKKES
jgi:hypothetical protein